MNTVSEFHAEAPQAIVSEGLAQGQCKASVKDVAASTGFELTTLRTNGVDSTMYMYGPPRVGRGSPCVICLHPA